MRGEIVRHIPERSAFDLEQYAAILPRGRIESLTIDHQSGRYFSYELTLTTGHTIEGLYGPFGWSQWELYNRAGRNVGVWVTSGEYEIVQADEDGHAWSIDALEAAILQIAKGQGVE